MARLLATLKRHRARLAEIRPRIEVVEFGGAAGTLATLGRIHSGRYQVAEFDVDMTSKSARAATDPNGPTGRLATWLADTKLADVPPLRARSR
jgi:hypothetical protein